MDVRKLKEHYEFELEGRWFAVEKALGAGAFGRTFLIHEKSNKANKSVLKALREEHFDNNDARKQFVGEYARLQQLRAVGASVPEPRIVDRSGSDSYFTMSLAPGEQLGTLARRGHRYGFIEKVAVALAIPFLATLHASHERRESYRDWDATNIFVNCDLSSVQTRSVDQGGVREEMQQAEQFNARANLSVAGAVTIIDWNVVNPFSDGNAAEWIAGDLARFFSVWAELVAGVPLRAATFRGYDDRSDEPTLRNVSPWLREVLARGLGVRKPFATAEEARLEFEAGLTVWSTNLDELIRAPRSPRFIDLQRETYIGHWREERSGRQPSGAFTQGHVDDKSVSDWTELIRACLALLTTIDREQNTPISEVLKGLIPRLERAERIAESMSPSIRERQKYRGIHGGVAILRDYVAFTQNPNLEKIADIARNLVSELDGKPRGSRQAIHTISTNVEVDFLDALLGYKERRNAVDELVEQLQNSPSATTSGADDIERLRSVVDAVDKRARADGNRPDARYGDWVRDWLLPSGGADVRDVLAKADHLQKSARICTDFRSHTALRPSSTDDSQRAILKSSLEQKFREHWRNVHPAHHMIVFDAYLAYHKAYYDLEANAKERINTERIAQAIAEAERAAAQARSARRQVAVTQGVMQLGAVIEVADARVRDEWCKAVTAMVEAWAEATRASEDLALVEQVPEVLARYLKASGAAGPLGTTWWAFDHARREAMRVQMGGAPEQAIAEVRGSLEARLRARWAAVAEAVAPRAAEMADRTLGELGPKGLEERERSIEVALSEVARFRFDVDLWPALVDEGGVRAKVVSEADGVAERLRVALAKVRAVRATVAVLQQRWLRAGDDARARLAVLEEATTAGVTFYDGPERTPGALAAAYRQAITVTEPPAGPQRTGGVVIQPGGGVSTPPASPSGAVAGADTSGGGPASLGTGRQGDQANEIRSEAGGAGNRETQGADGQGEAPPVTDTPAAVMHSDSQAVQTAGDTDALNGVVAAAEALPRGDIATVEYVTWRDIVGKERAIGRGRESDGGFVRLKAVRERLVAVGLVNALNWGKSVLVDGGSTRGAEEMRAVLAAIDDLLKVDGRRDERRQKRADDWEPILKRRKEVEDRERAFGDGFEQADDIGATTKQMGTVWQTSQSASETDYLLDIGARLAAQRALSTDRAKIDGWTEVLRAVMARTSFGRQLTSPASQKELQEYDRFVRGIEAYAKQVLSASGTKVMPGANEQKSLEETRRAWEQIQADPKQAWIARFVRRILQVQKS